jgi:hypothetical protein
MTHQSPYHTKDRSGDIKMISKHKDLPTKKLREFVLTDHILDKMLEVFDGSRSLRIKAGAVDRCVAGQGPVFHKVYRVVLRESTDEFH